MYLRRSQLGLGGSGATAIKATQTSAAAAAPVITGALAAHASASIAAGGSGLILGIAPALAVPVIGAAIAGITILATKLIANSGCGQTCIVTSQWANQAAQLLDQNIATYFAQPTPRTESQRNAALANFDAIWARLVAMCSDPSTGDAGKRCISDRQAGACVWHQTADKVPAWGTPPDGACWNWFSGYRDPIANDPDVVPDSAAQNVTGVLEAAVSSPSSNPLAFLALLAAGGLLVWAVAS